VKPGDAVPALERTLELHDLVAYGSATWDWHPMHYDRAWSDAAGLPAPVVDGQMLGALMAEQVLDWLGPRAFVERLSFRFKAMVYAGETVRCEGEVASVEDGARVRVLQKVLVEDRVAATGEAVVRL
jgi:acyl dehydratase